MCLGFGVGSCALVAFSFGSSVAALRWLTKYDCMEINVYIGNMKEKERLLKNRIENE